ncbi:DUF2927 domain-containing protein [Actibacterium pelagium]|uniref:ATP-dependent transcriptional regulator n=1 Tax=Actibacterium pelagium TaxID=2029103 RepID=A0A917AFI8_9RHOB|nr:DUF2927 domain-containing protein [Actibacterium pelagium]GGE44843.1 hypothetical protein GCM10011517_10550 [Actibacterium pelagium]
MLRKAVLLCLALGACAAEPQAPTAQPSDLPAMKRFSGAPTRSSPRSNTEIAEDFLDLAFQMESGLKLKNMSRFQGPVTLRVTGKKPPTLQTDLDNLISRLRREARIDIREVPATQPANITVAVVSRSQIARAIPGAACFVMPNVSSLEELRRNHRAASMSWTALQERTSMAIFLPGDESPQEIRDCLNEEIAQALGPVNDLYRLHDSVFNDDNMHTVLTSFDMLILRAFYDPAMPTGLTRNEAAARIPGVLSRINPTGRGYGGTPLADTPRTWTNAIEGALQASPGSSRAQRSAETAVRIAVNAGWNDGRLAFSQFVLGRALIGRDNENAARFLLLSEKTYVGLGRTDLQAAHVSLHLSAFALATGQYDVVLDRVDHYSRVVSGHQNAALLAKMLMLKAEALDRLNRGDAAKKVRLDSLGWARYGFGSEQKIRAELREIAAIGKGSTS